MPQINDIVGKCMKTNATYVFDDKIDTRTSMPINQSATFFGAIFEENVISKKQPTNSSPADSPSLTSDLAKLVKTEVAPHS